MKLIFRIYLRIEKIVSRFLPYHIYERVQRRLSFPKEKVHYFLVHGHFPNFSTPETFNEKILYKKLYERNPLLPIITDKYAVREHLKSKGYECILIPLQWVGKNAFEIPFDNLNYPCIIKTNFSSGQNQILWKKPNDIDLLMNLFNNWMKMKYKHSHLFWFTQQIDRKIVVENLLLTNLGTIPDDFKFFVFHGRVKYINIILNRGTLNEQRGLVNPDFSKVNIRWGKWELHDDLVPPSNLDEMITIAESLGSEFAFMRVDLYNLGGIIYFGELTPFPADGKRKIEPKSFDKEIGSLLSID